MISCQTVKELSIISEIDPDSAIKFISGSRWRVLFFVEAGDRGSDHRGMAGIINKLRHQQNSKLTLLNATSIYNIWRFLRFNIPLKNIKPAMINQLSGGFMSRDNIRDHFPWRSQIDAQP